jgi:hypothetical protein
MHGLNLRFDISLSLLEDLLFLAQFLLKQIHHIPRLGDMNQSLLPEQVCFGFFELVVEMLSQKTQLAYHKFVL